MKLDPKNLKAIYRSGRAFYFLGKLEEAEQIASYGREIDPNNESLVELSREIQEKKSTIEEKERKKRQAELKRIREQQVMDKALRSRNYSSLARASKEMTAPDDFKLELENPEDPTSALFIPMTIYYPSDSMFDMCPRFSESFQLQDALQETLFDSTPPWFSTDQHVVDYQLSNLDIFCETSTKGLARVKLDHTPSKILSSMAPRIPMIDGRLALYVVPKNKSGEFIRQWKQDNGLDRC
jgi:hypothetical protein